MVKKDKPRVPRQDEVYNSGNEPSDEDELRAYLIHATVGMWNQQYLYPKNPIVVEKLLQYSGSRVEHRDGFSSYK